MTTPHLGLAQLCNGDEKKIACAFELSEYLDNNQTLLVTSWSCLRPRPESSFKVPVTIFFLLASEALKTALLVFGMELLTMYRMSEFEN